MEIFQIVVDGQIIKGHKWLVPSSKGTVFIFQGMEEHSARYDQFATFLNDHNLDVYALDTYGQGLNTQILSDRGIWPEDGFEKMVKKYHQLIKEVKETSQDKPLYIFSHSMGSFMGQRYIQLYPHFVNKIVLCGSAGKNPVAGLGLLLAKITVNKKNRTKKNSLISKMMFGNFNKGIKNPKTTFDWLSYNEENVEKYINDTLCGFGANKGFCLEFLKGLNTIYKKEELKKVSLDEEIFIITGKDDPVSNFAKEVDKLLRMYQSLGLKKLHSKIYQGMRHEILNEDDKQIVFNDVLKFFIEE